MESKEYILYRSESLAHAAKGSIWSNHKYINKYFKNGKWVYIYKGAIGKVTNSINKIRNSLNAPKASNKNTHTINDYKVTNEYYVGNSKGLTHTVEKTRNGSSWLSKKITVQHGNEVVILKDKGKIAQGVEKAINKGSSFIKKLSNRPKKKKKSNIKVTGHVTTTG